MARNPKTRLHMSPSCVEHYRAPPTARPTLIDPWMPSPKKGMGRRHNGNNAPSSKQTPACWAGHRRCWWQLVKDWLAWTIHWSSHDVNQQLNSSKYILCWTLQIGMLALTLAMHALSLPQLGGPMYVDLSGEEASFEDHIRFSKIFKGHDDCPKKV